MIDFAHSMAERLDRNRVKRSGSVVKRVKCEGCAGEYFYLLERTASGSDTWSKAKSARLAERNLAWALEHDFDVVPCPACGWYQANMVKREKHRAGKDMNAIALLALMLGLMMVVAGFSPARMPPEGHVLCVAIGVGGIVISGVLARVAWNRKERCDPNATDKEERMRLGQSRSLSRAQAAALGTTPSRAPGAMG
jgi:hypothetical protein